MLRTRIYVHESIAEKYLEGLKARVEGFAASLGAGPFEMSTMSSLLFHSRQKETVMRFFEQRGSGYRWEYLGEFGVFCGADDFL